MPENPAELQKLVKQARHQFASRSQVVDKCQKRIDKFKRKFHEAKNKRKHFLKHHHPRRAEFWGKRQARNAKKITFWTRREADAIEAKAHTKAWLARLRKRQAAIQPQGGNLVSKARSYIGVHELGAQQRAWAGKLGYSPYLPWCSIFVANMLLEAGICTRDQLPSNPAYSGAWIGWNHGRRINTSERRPGDIVIFDWGDGGMTDHVAIYEGSGRHVGGNQSDAVTESYTPSGNLVAVVRPI